MSYLLTKLYGPLDFPITLPKEVRRRGSLDTVEQTFNTGRRKVWEIDDARSGRVSTFPGYSSMYIDEIDRVEEVREGTIVNGRVVGSYEQRIKGLGLLDGRDKIISDPTSTPEEGWDTGEHEVYTLRPDLYQLKQPHPLIPTLYVVDRSSEIEIGRVKRMRVSYKGVVPVSHDDIRESLQALSRHPCER